MQPKWERWDLANSVAKEGNWLVVRQPDEGFCYVKQGYDGYEDKLEIIVKKQRKGSGLDLKLSSWWVAKYISSSGEASNLDLTLYSCILV